jgi:uncharacterized cupredoxin-like copper-binding protein
MLTRPWFRASVVAVTAVALLLTASCSKADGKAVEVVSTKTECTPATTHLGSGKVTFRVVNKGTQPTELYVLTTSGATVGEVENVGPGTSRTLTATLGRGTYELSCKPGQTGKGIRTKITVTGDAINGGADQAHDVEVPLVAKDHVYVGAVPAIKAGQRVEFKLDNKGTTDHELEVFGPDGKALGEIGPTPKGKTGTVVLALAEPGAYLLKCGISDHAKRGMTRTFNVT